MPERRDSPKMFLIASEENLRAIFVPPAPLGKIWTFSLPGFPVESISKEEGGNIKEITYGRDNSGDQITRFLAGYRHISANSTYEIAQDRVVGIEEVRAAKAAQRHM